MSRPGFLICVCPDPQLTKDHINGLISSIPASEGQWERHAYWGDEGLPPAFWENLTLQGLFATPKALVVRNAHTLPIAEWRKLSAALAKSTPLAWPFFCMEGQFDRGKHKVPKNIQKLQCWNFAEKKGWIWLSSGLDERGLRQFVQSFAARNGLNINGPALQAIVRVLPTDAATATTEMEKIALATDASRNILPEHANLIQHSADMDIFTFINAIQQGRNLEQVWEKIRGSEASGDAMLFPFLAMLQREARILWQLLAGEEVRLPYNVLSAKTNMAKRLGRQKLSRIWDLALEADRGVKTGERNPEQAMEMLVAGLFALFSPPKQQSHLQHR